MSQNAINCILLLIRISHNSCFNCHDLPQDEPNNILICLRQAHYRKMIDHHINNIKVKRMVYTWNQTDDQNADKSN